MLVFWSTFSIGCRQIGSPRLRTSRSRSGCCVGTILPLGLINRVPFTEDDFGESDRAVCRTKVASASITGVRGARVDCAHHETIGAD